MPKIKISPPLPPFSAYARKLTPEEKIKQLQSMILKQKRNLLSNKKLFFYAPIINRKGEAVAETQAEKDAIFDYCIPLFDEIIEIINYKRNVNPKSNESEE